MASRSICHATGKLAVARHDRHSASTCDEPFGLGDDGVITGCRSPNDLDSLGLVSRGASLTLDNDDPLGEPGVLGQIERSGRDSVGRKPTDASDEPTCRTRTVVPPAVRHGADDVRGVHHDDRPHLEERPETAHDDAKPGCRGLSATASGAVHASSRLSGSLIVGSKGRVTSATTVV